jgi:transposase
MGYATYFLTRPQHNWLAALLPEPSRRTKSFVPNHELLSGIVYVLRTGCRWQDLPSSICPHGYSTC